MSQVFNKLFKNPTRNEIMAQFYRKPEHEWIRGDGRISKIFDMLITSLPTEYLNELFVKNETLFILQRERLSTVLCFSPKTRIILVFENLIDLIKTVNATQAVAVLAYELGHLVFKHDKRRPDNLQAQLEADMFAIRLGFVQDLLDFLSDQMKTHDLIMRIGQVQNYLSAA